MCAVVSVWVDSCAGSVGGRCGVPGALVVWGREFGRAGARVVSGGTGLVGVWAPGVCSGVVCGPFGGRGGVGARVRRVAGTGGCVGAPVVPGAWRGQPDGGAHLGW